MKLRGRKALRLAALAALATASLAACGVLKTPEPPKPPAAIRPAADAEAAREYLTALQELLAGAPAHQAEIFQSAKVTAENYPTTLNRLRFALMLAVPGHAATDPVAARRQLADLLARPELLLPAERALAAVHLADVDERLVLIETSRQQQAEALARDKERGAATAKRLAQEQDESARLRRALEEAQRKLEAVMQVERSIVGSDSPPKP